MNRGTVIDHFLRNWDYAQRTASISKPFSWALLETWKWVDEREKPREVLEDGITFEQLEYKLSELRDKCIKYKEDGCCKYIDCGECDYKCVCEEWETKDGNVER